MNTTTKRDEDKIVALFPGGSVRGARPEDTLAEAGPTWAPGDALLDALERGQAVVDDPRVLAGLLAERYGHFAQSVLRRAVDDLVAAGLLQRVMVLDQVHLMQGRRTVALPLDDGTIDARPARRFALEQAHPRFSESADIHQCATRPGAEVLPPGRGARAFEPERLHERGPAIQVLPVVIAPQPSESPAANADEEEAAFRLELELDTEHERLLLLRVVIVVEVLIGLLLAREWLLWTLA